ncbi:MAG TPA: UbiX family flavin prenyltransferase [Spirochaetota bacterium]|nr:UbiX family flavin prenyltransferase [Spirochaetota bacterium]HNT12706.1 UbiX family flavin prenyltransferase [Spirochaetota bacterium]
MHVVAITGASGAIIGIRLVEELLRSGARTAVVVSDTARAVIRHEVLRDADYATMRALLERRGRAVPGDALREFDPGDLFAPIASGSFRFASITVAPCSMKTLSAVAHGHAEGLINRAVDVALKERRRCVLVPRETPVSEIHLENMLRARRAGADILLPVPAFYHHPRSLDDVVDFIVGRALSLVGIEHALFTQWGDDASH